MNKRVYKGMRMRCVAAAALLSVLGVLFPYSSSTRAELVVQTIYKFFPQPDKGNLPMTPNSGRAGW